MCEKQCQDAKLSFETNQKTCLVKIGQLQKETDLNMGILRSRIMR